MNFFKTNFSNRDVNNFNLHYGLIRFAEGISTTFGIIILYKMGFQIYQIFIIFGFMHFLRIFIRAIIPLCLKKYGLKNIVKFGTLIYIFLLPSFYLLTKNILPIWIYILIFAFITSFYWYPFHILYGIIGDSEQRGKQSAIKEAYYRLASILSPLFSGVIMTFFGDVGLFITGTLIFIIALIPLLKIKTKINLDISLNFKEGIKNSTKYHFFMSLFFSFWETFFDYAWIFVVFFLFNENSVELGLLLSISIFFRIIIEFFIGHHIDLRKKIKWYYIGAIIIIFSILARILYGYTINLIILTNLVLMLGYSLFIPYESIVVYNSIKDSKNPEWVAMLGEAGRDLGTLISSLTIAILCYFGYDLRYMTSFGIIAIILTIFLYNSYFKYIFKN